MSRPARGREGQGTIVIQNAALIIALSPVDGLASAEIAKPDLLSEMGLFIDADLLEQFGAARTRSDHDAGIP